MDIVRQCAIRILFHFRLEKIMGIFVFYRSFLIKWCKIHDYCSSYKEKKKKKQNSKFASFVKQNQSETWLQNLSILNNEYCQTICEHNFISVILVVIFCLRKLCESLLFFIEIPLVSGAKSTIIVAVVN